MHAKTNTPSTDNGLGHKSKETPRATNNEQHTELELVLITEVNARTDPRHRQRTARPATVQNLAGVRW